MTESDDDAALRLEIGLRKLAEKFSAETFEDNKRLVAELSKLTSGLRELAEKWRKEAQQLDEHPVNYDPSLILQECVRELLALLPEATKEPHV